MPAARARERSSASSSTGTSSRRRRATRPDSPARSACAARTRRTLSANCGSTVTATTSAVPISYSAGGTERSSRLGLARAFAAPTQITMVASRIPSYRPASSESRRERAEQRDAGDPAGQRDRGQVEQHHGVGAGVPAAEHHPEQHPQHHDQHAQRDVQPERARPGLRAAARHHDQRRHPDQQQEQQRVRGHGRRGGEADRPQPPRHRVQVARQPGAHGEHPGASTAYDGRRARGGDQQADRPRRHPHRQPVVRRVARPSGGCVSGPGWCRRRRPRRPCGAGRSGARRPPRRPRSGRGWPRRAGPGCRCRWRRTATAPCRRRTTTATSRRRRAGC